MSEHIHANYLIERHEDGECLECVERNAALKAAEAERDALLAAAQMGYSLIMEIGLIDNGASGNTDPTGHIDEGVVLTARAVESLRAAIALRSPGSPGSAGSLVEAIRQQMEREEGRDNG